MSANLPPWEVMYVPGNVSDYLIGYLNDEVSAKAAGEAWLRSQKQDLGRLEWHQPNTGSQWFELCEIDEDGSVTDPGILVRELTPADDQRSLAALRFAVDCATDTLSGVLAVEQDLGVLELARKVFDALRPNHSDLFPPDDWAEAVADGAYCPSVEPHEPHSWPWNGETLSCPGRAPLRDVSEGSR